MTIEDDVFIGQASTLVSGKAERIGRNTIIGAGSVVTKPIPENVVALGMPARIVKRR